MYYALKTELIQQRINFLCTSLLHHTSNNFPCCWSSKLLVPDLSLHEDKTCKIESRGKEIFLCTLHISPSSCEHLENTETSDDELSTPVKVGGI